MPAHPWAKVLYTAEATVEGGRAGHGRTSDGRLDLQLERVGKARLINAYVDTVSVARRKFPGQRVSLDALCERFSIDNSSRTKHGALLDSELLAEVYLELSGGRQRDLGLAPEMAARVSAGLSLAGGSTIRPA